MASQSQDLSDIIRLLKLERYYRDTAQWDVCRKTYHPDSSKTYVNVAWYEGEIDEFMQKSAQAYRGKVNIIHAAFDPVDIAIKGRRATSQAFCSVTSGVTLEEVDYELCSHMRLFTRLEKLEDTNVWRIVALESTYVRDRLVTAFPAPSGHGLVVSDTIKAFPKPYRSLALVMASRGLQPRPSLPHEDDQDSVQKIVDKNRTFVEAGSG